MISNNKNLSCRYAARLLDYLYDECAEAERSAFETHLQNCGACIDELANLTLTRASISEWRAKDFEPLPTPFVVLPAIRETSVGKQSLLDLIRSIFNFSPARAIFAAVLVFAILGAAFVLITNRFRSNDPAANLAQTEGETIRPQPAKMSDEMTVQLETKKPQDKNATKLNSPDSGNQNSGAEDNSPSAKNSIPAIIPVVQKITNKKSAPKISTNPKLKVPAKNNVPAIEDDDEDDRTLRLSDLFEEVGMNQPVEREHNANEK